MPFFAQKNDPKKNINQSFCFFWRCFQPQKCEEKKINGGARTEEQGRTTTSLGVFAVRLRNGGGMVAQTMAQITFKCHNTHKYSLTKHL